MTSLVAENGFWGKAWGKVSFFLTEPIETAIELAPQTLITSASVFMVAQFGMSHGILSWEIAWLMAVGFEWTWLRGVRTAGLVKRTVDSERWIKLLTGTALVTVIAYGMLYIIGLPIFGVIPEHPGQEWGIALAVAKVVPIALMGYAAANLHRIHKQEVLRDARMRQEEAETRVRRLQAEQDERSLKHQQELDAIAVERERKLADLELWQKGQEMKRALRAQSRTLPVPQQRKRPITINGVTYESRAAAAQAIGVTPQAISKRARRES
jgi:hypothetical protein